MKVASALAASRCRTSRRTASKDDDERGREVDALYAHARRMVNEQPHEWPDLIVMLGDQVYVDEGSPNTREFIR